MPIWLPTLARKPGILKDSSFLTPTGWRGERPQTRLRESWCDDFVRFLPGSNRVCASPSLTLHQAVTLASLIEKETSVDAERELISAVFHNRLKKGMLLQCDPTVIYAAQLKGNYRGTIFQSDLESNSPYNTYRHPGLPPGPIANPGKRSLEAALSPAQLDYLYFVADNRGGHVFSRTLTEHQRAVSAYRKGLAAAEKSLKSLPKSAPHRGKL